MELGAVSLPQGWLASRLTSVLVLEDGTLFQCAQPPLPRIEGGKGAVGRQGKGHRDLSLCHFIVRFHRMVVEAEKAKNVIENCWLSSCVQP